MKRTVLAVALTVLLIGGLASAAPNRGGVAAGRARPPIPSTWIPTNRWRSSTGRSSRTSSTNSSTSTRTSRSFRCWRRRGRSPPTARPTPSSSSPTSSSTTARRSTPKPVKYNFERMLGIADPSFFSPRRSEVNLVQKVTVVDPLTVQIDLDKPFSPFLATLSDRAGMMVSPTAARRLGRGFALEPVGTGPYKFVERRPQERMVLERFDRHWDKSAGHVDRITLSPVYGRAGAPGQPERRRAGHHRAGAPHRDPEPQDRCPPEAAGARGPGLEGHLDQRLRPTVQQPGAAAGVQRHD